MNAAGWKILRTKQCIEITFLGVKIHFEPGYRYCTKRRNKLVLLTAGGDKSNQERDIAKARIKRN